MTPDDTPNGSTDRAEADRAITKIRQRMDTLDAQLVALLNERASCARDIGLLKHTVGLEVYQPGREIEVLNHVRGHNHGPLDAGAVTRIFERIIDESRRLERTKG